MQPQKCLLSLPQASFGMLWYATLIPIDKKQLLIVYSHIAACQALGDGCLISKVSPAEVSVNCLEHASCYIMLSSLEREKITVDKALETTGFVSLWSNLIFLLKEDNSVHFTEAL